jgi:hypothetical protein
LTEAHAHREAQLDWERRMSRPAAAAAFAALVLGFAFQVLSASTVARTGGQRADLIKLDQNAGQLLAATVLQALSVFLVAAVLLYLLRAARFRRTEGVMPAVGPLVMLAPFLIAAGSILSTLEIVDIARDFTDSGPRTERRADALVEDRGAAPVFVTFAGNIALGFGFVVVSLSAMRVGLTTRFLGIIGVIVGALYVIPLLGGPIIIQIFWLGAIGAVFLGFWPGGRGEAWETGEPTPWPSAAELRRHAIREERERAEAGEQPRPAPQAAGESEAAPGKPEAPRHPASKKRRKKRRR